MPKKYQCLVPMIQGLLDRDPVDRLSMGSLLRRRQSGVRALARQVETDMMWVRSRPSLLTPIEKFDNIGMDQTNVREGT